ncbi:NAC domain-containing protein 83-like [Phragmites australis]|uniref:NAC domain-containing protein 83-like n=1 Tax=Phragmites australis TaxID=29695 RepID=UPI002D78CC59|nr:NAC domain-containing protein 83-like [Phragmites australis]
MALLPPPRGLPPGLVFYPSDADLLSAYLRRKIAGEPLPAAAAKFFHDADVYAADPDTLTGGYQGAPGSRRKGGYWFFLTHARPKNSSRQVGDGEGAWCSVSEKAGAWDVVDGEGHRVRRSQMFAYKPKNMNGGSSDWYMVEFAAEDQEDYQGRGGEQEQPVLVLCKIYQSLRRVHPWIPLHAPGFVTSGSWTGCSASNEFRVARERNAL